jgi:transposase
VNVLKPHLRTTIETLLAREVSQRQIARQTGVDRKTIRAYARAFAAARASAVANSPGVATGSPGADTQIPPPRPPGSPPSIAVSPAVSPSACQPHRAWIEEQLALGRNAVAIYQDLVDQHGFAAGYNSVKRFVAKLRAREPDRFDVLEFLPAEEAQVDWGTGALTLVKPAAPGRKAEYRRPALFVLTLRYSGKAFRKVVWKVDEQTWVRLHEEAFHTLGGGVAYVVLDNLRQGVLRPDLYEPELNPVYAAMLAHYGMVADPCRVGDPNRKGSVESAIKHTQQTPLKGKRFDSLEAQNAYLAEWEERWAAPRIHGRKKRQVLDLYREELPHLRPLPAERFRIFKQEVRTVDDAGLIQVGGSYYAALPAAPHSVVTVRIYDTELELLDLTGAPYRRHRKAAQKGSFTLEDGDRLFNPSRETARLLRKTELIGPRTARFAQELFARHGRPGQRALYGLANLARTYPRADIEAVCDRLLAADCFSYAAVKRALERLTTAQASTGTATASTIATATASSPSSMAAPADPLAQTGSPIRPVTEYQAFWDTHALARPLTPLTPLPEN